MTDYQWSNDMGKFRVLLDEGADVICLGIGNMIYQCAKNTDGRYLIYGTTYEKWQDVEKSDVGLYLKFLPTVHEPTASEILDTLIRYNNTYEFATGWIKIVETTETYSGFETSFDFVSYSGGYMLKREIIGAIRDYTQSIHVGREVYYNYRALLKYECCEDPTQPHLVVHEMFLTEAHMPNEANDIDNSSDLPF